MKKQKQIAETEKLTHICNNCYKRMALEKSIVFPFDEGKDHAIWFTSLRKDFSFNGEVFCSLKCLLNYIRAWYDRELADNRKTIKLPLDDYDEQPM